MASNFNFEYRSCKSKRRYGSHAEASAYAHLSRKHGGGEILPYNCSFCGGWHIGHPPKRAIEVQLAELQTSQLAALPRTTRWRASERGSVRLTTKLLAKEEFAALFRPEPEPEKPAPHGWPPKTPNWEIYNSLLDEVEKDCKIMSGWACRKGLPIPSYMDREDLAQDLAGYLLALSGKEGFQATEWRRKACRLRIFQIVKWRCRYDADRHNQEQIFEY